ncbi:MAG: Jag N-terminal domain-containing protein [Thermaerobacter sp.]|jgi:spoIIIJ-associated protein|nr:Jag N-terminal domain-containing protein [Thermaerobacter sp.]
MKALEKSGRTVEEATAAALAELGLAREHAQVEVLDEGSRGLFGLLGNKEALVRVSPLVDKLDTARDFLMRLLTALGFEAVVDGAEEEECLRLEVSGEATVRLIGKQGEVLDALQFLLNVATSRAVGGGKRLVVDVDGFRAKREQAVRHLALQVAEKVQRTGERAVLEAMNAHERKVVHLALQELAAVETHSEGEEPHRRVVIEPRR